MHRVKLSWLAPTACLFSACLLQGQQPPDASALARKALDLFLSGKYPEMEDMFAPNLKESLGLPALTKLGGQVKEWGTPEIGQPSVRAAGTTRIVATPLKFPNQNINLQVAVNSSGELTYFFMLPGAVPWQHPSYSKAGAFQERNVTVGDDPIKLPGTLTLPTGSGPFPAAVLVHDTGPNDRDETVGAVKLFRDLAEGLSSRGIAVLCYEKRTKVYGSKVTASSYTPDDETIDDALSAIDVLRKQPEVNGQKIFVVGHGLGGYLAPRIAEDAKANGIIILSANEKPLEDVMLEQASGLNLPDKEMADLKAANARVKKLQASDEDQPNVLGLPAAYWVNLKGYDPIQTARKLSLPVLVLVGDRDPQVSADEVNLWKSGLSGQKGATVKTYPGLNHSFVAGQGKSTEAEYRKPGHADAAVIEDIAAFVGK